MPRSLKPKPSPSLATASWPWVRTADIRARAAGSEVLDLGGHFVVPGFIDSHVHFIEGGFRLTSVQLRDAKTRAEFVDRIKAYAATVPSGTWIIGGDWDHTLWGGELPRRDWIDAVTPDHPVWINRLDGHMALANTAALRATGVADNVTDVPGGEILRDSRGRPTGLLKDNAMDLVAAKTSAARRHERSRARRRDEVRGGARGHRRPSHGNVGGPRHFRTRLAGRTVEDAYPGSGAAGDVGAAARHGRREALRSGRTR